MSDEKPPIWFASTPRSVDSYFYKLFMDAETHNDMPTSAMWKGIDWCVGYGKVRGEVIKKDGNVTHVRFKTVDFEKE